MANYQRFGSDFEINAYVGWSYQDVTGSFHVHPATNSAPQAVRLANGNFAAVWASSADSEAGSGTTYRIRARILDPLGRPIGSEFTVTYPSSTTPPSILALSNGGFLVAWNGTAYVPDGSGGYNVIPGVLGQILDATGATVGGQIILDSAPPGTYLSLDQLAADADGGFVLTEHVSSQQSGSTVTTIAAKRFDNSGTSVGPSVTVQSTTSTGLYSRSTVAALPGNLSFVAWIDTASGNACGQCYHDDGTAAGAQIVLGAYYGSSVNAAALSSGGFVVSWVSSSTVVSTQRFDASGAKIGSVISYPVSSQTANTGISSASVTALASGGFVVSQADSDGTTRAQAFDQTGAPAGGEFFVQSTSIATGANDQILSLGTRQDTYGGQTETNILATLDVASGPAAGPFQFAGPESTVYNYGFSNRRTPLAASLAGGGYVVAMSSISGGRTNEFVQLFDATGAPVNGGELVLSGPSTYYDYYESFNASLASLSSGGYVIAYTERHDNLGTPTAPANTYSDSYKVETFDTTGALVGASITLSFAPLGVAGLSNGGFAVLGGGQVQLFNAAGQATGAPIQLTSPALYQSQSIAALSNGQFLVSWTGSSPGAVTAQIFGADGTAVGGIIAVSSSPTYVNGAPRATLLSDGSFVVTWTVGTYDSTGGHQAVRAQHFDASGGKLGGELQVNSSPKQPNSNNDDMQPEVVAIANGGFVIAWVDSSVWNTSGGGSSSVNPGTDPNYYQSYNYNQDGSDIRAQAFDKNNNRIGGEFVVTASNNGFRGDPALASRPGGGFVAAWSNYSNHLVEEQVFTPANFPPIAGNDAFTITEDTSITIQTSTLLANDSDGGGAALSIAAVGGAAHGTVAFTDASKTAIVFTPDANYNGPASFTYTLAHASNAATTTGTVSLTVTPVEDAPTGGVVIAGTPQQNVTLTATSTLADADGLGAFSYQWLRNGTAITGATAASYMARAADVGAALTVQISYTDGGGTAEQVTSAPTAPVAAGLPIASLAAASVTEGNSGTTNAVFTVTLSDPATSAVTIHYATSAGTATSGTDFTPTTGTLTIAAGQTTATIAVPVIGDTGYEPDENFTLTLSAPAGVTFAGGGATLAATGTILNDDPIPATTVVSMAAPVAQESDGNMVFIVTLANPTTAAVTMSYRSSGLSGSNIATPGSDYTAVSGTLTIAAGATQGVITVPLAADGVIEPNEIFNLQLSNLSTNATFSTGATTVTKTATIIDSDSPAMVAWVHGSAIGQSGPVGEASQLVYVDVVLQQASVGQAITVNYATSDGTAKAGSDYTATSGTLTIAAGSIGTYVAAAGGYLYTGFSVPITNDAIAESTESFNVTFSSPNGVHFYESPTLTSTVTILDDDQPPTIAIASASTLEGASGTKTLNFTVTLSSAAGQPVTIPWSTANGTATAGSDYVATSGTLTIAPGQTTGTIPVTINGDTTYEPNETFTLNLGTPTNATYAGGATTATATGTITNDDSVATATIAPVTIAEGSSGTSNAVFTVTLGNPSSAPVTIAYATSDGTALAGQDYVTTSGTLTIAAGQTSGTILVPVYGDSFYEADESFGLTLSSPNGGRFAGDVASIATTGTITNDDAAAPSAATISCSTPTVIEGNSGTTQMAFVVTLSNATSTPTTINYRTADGSATAGSDYAATNGVLTIAAGQTTGTIYVPVYGDTAVEPYETLTLQLSSPSGASFAGGATSYNRTGTIADDDAPVVSFGNASVVEGNSGTTNAVFTVTLSNASPTPVTMSYATADGTATAGSDYAATSGTLTFAAGQTSATISVPVIGDTTIEGNETFTLRLSGASGATFTGGGSTYAKTGTIINDDSLTATIGNASLVEGASGTTSEVFTVSLNGSAAAPVTIAYATANGTATAGSDYGATSGTLTIAAGQSSATISVPVYGDTVVEPDESFGLTLSSPSGVGFAGGATTTSATGTILNDDYPSATIGNVAIVEGASGSTNAVFTVSLSAAAPGPVSIAYATGDGTATAGSDYTAASGTLTIAAGQTSGTIVVPILGDTAIEPDETFGITLSSPVGVTFAGGAATASATGTILNDDYPLATIGDVTIAEGNSGTTSAVFTVTLASASATPVTIGYATADGTATAGSDYTAKSGTLTIAPGQTSGTISVPVIGDAIVEGNETFALNLSSPVGASFAGGAASIAGTATITNDDIATVNANNPTVTEGNSGTTNAVFTVTLSNASATPITMNYATADGTATAGSDYVATSGTLTFAAGSKTATIVVPVIGDTLVEGNETFTLRLSSLKGAVFSGGGSTFAKVGTIANDDTAPTGPIATIANVSSTEGASGSANAAFTVNLSTASATPVTIAYATSDGTATAGSDYTATTGTLTIAAGQTSGTIFVPVLGDTTVEADETYTLTLSSPSGASFTGGAGTATATGTILNDDYPVASVGNVSLVEGNSGTTNAVFTVTLSSASTAPVAIGYATANGTATAGSDYTAKSGTLTIAAGQTSGTIIVPVIGDTIVEGNETFALNLSATPGVILGNGTATGTITNDDTATVNANNPTVTEGNSGTTNAVFTVTLSNASATAITMNYATADGTATAGSDYVATTGTLTFAAGSKTATISVPVIGDTLVEGNETFTLRLSALKGAVFSGGGSTFAKVGTIANDDVAAAPTLADAPTVSVAPGVAGAASGLVVVNSTGGAAFSEYQFVDQTDGNGTLLVSGAAQATGQTIDVMANLLSTVQFTGASAGASDQIWVRAANSAGWSNWSHVTALAASA